MTFTEGQQAFIDALINKRAAEIKTKAETKLREELASAELRYKEQTATLETQLAELKKSSVGGKLDKLADLEARNAALIEREKRTTLLAACAELGAVSAEQVATLVTPYIRTDEDGDIYVVTQAGETRYGADGRPVSVKAAVAEFLENNPHLVKAGGQPGAGSQSPKGLTDNSVAMSRAAFDRLPPEKRMDFTLSGGTVRD